MTKAEIINRIAAGTGLTKFETEAVVNGFITTVKAALVEGDRVELRGFGSFNVQYRAPRLARNPKTQEPIEIAAQYVPVFKPARELREGVNAARTPKPAADR